MNNFGRTISARALRRFFYSPPTNLTTPTNLGALPCPYTFRNNRFFNFITRLPETRIPNVPRIQPFSRTLRP